MKPNSQSDTILNDEIEKKIVTSSNYNVMKSQTFLY